MLEPITEKDFIDEYNRLVVLNDMEDDGIFINRTDGSLYISATNPKPMTYEDVFMVIGETKDELSRRLKVEYTDEILKALGFLPDDKKMKFTPMGQLKFLLELTESLITQIHTIERLGDEIYETLTNH